MHLRSHHLHNLGHAKVALCTLPPCNAILMTRKNEHNAHRGHLRLHSCTNNQDMSESSLPCVFPNFRLDTVPGIPSCTRPACTRRDLPHASYCAIRLDKHRLCSRNTGNLNIQLSLFRYRCTPALRSCTSLSCILKGPQPL